MTGTVTDGTTTKRGKTNGYKNAKSKAKQDQKRNEADKRNFEHNSMTLEEKIAKVQYRIKQGLGESKKELARLNKQLAERPPELAPVKKGVAKKTYSKPSKS
jgi:hypothetical protein